MSKPSRLFVLRLRQIIFKKSYSEDTSKPGNKLEAFQTSHLQPEKGAIYDKKPFKVTLEAGKTYAWCVCGKSKSQPLCDGTHKEEYLKSKFRPVKFEVATTKPYYLCNCKQTSKRPFCDGTHKQEAIQAAATK